MTRDTKHEEQAQRFSLIDVGSSGGLHPRWQRFAPFIRNCGFEPNPEEFGKLTSSADCLWINAGLAGASGKRELFLTRAYQNSSLLKPNQEFISSLEWGRAHDVIESPMVDCLTLDEALTGHGILADFVKIDTQGSELEILQGGPKALSSCVCVELEVEFVELYCGQPRFAEVDQFMRQNGFYLGDLSNLLHVKQRGRVGCGGPKGRLISADALYFRETEALLESGDTMEICHHRITAQLIAHLAYGFVDLAAALAEGSPARECGYRMPDFLEEIFRKEMSRKNAGDLYPFADKVSRGIKKLGRLLTPNRSALWNPELGNPRWRKS